MSDELPELVADVDIPESDLARIAIGGFSKYLDEKPVKAFCPKCGARMTVGSQESECPECGLPIRLELRPPRS